MKTIITYETDAGIKCDTEEEALLREAYAREVDALDAQWREAIQPAHKVYLAAVKPLGVEHDKALDALNERYADLFKKVPGRGPA